jgi:hypothetical protein
MTNTITKKPLLVRAKNSTDPYVTVPLQQLDAVQALLDAAGIPYRLDDEFLSINDGPEMAFVNIPKPADPKVVQQLLDSVA